MAPEANDSGDDWEPPLTQTFDTETPASIAVIQAIAVMENVDPVEMSTELGITLFDHVDPEALDTLTTDRPDDGGLLVEFSIEEYRVEISDTGRIRVFPQ